MTACAVTRQGRGTGRWDGQVPHTHRVLLAPSEIPSAVARALWAALPSAAPGQVPVEEAALGRLLWTGGSGDGGPAGWGSCPLPDP